MTTRQKQSIFVKLVAQLITKAYEMGYELTFGEALRSPEQAALNAKSGAGITNSLHIQKLAIDLNLFKDGVFLSSSEAHKPLGEYWESLSTPDYTCCWGGRFKPRPDGNHYSIAHAGLK
jgi:hypothetical protein